MGLVQDVYLPEAAWPVASRAMMGGKLAALIAWKLTGVREACPATGRMSLAQSDLNEWKLGRMLIVLDTGFNSPASSRSGRYQRLESDLEIKEVVTRADRSSPHLQSLMPALSLIGMIDTQKADTRGHAARVALLADRMGEAMGLGAEERSCLRLAGLAHDLGKIDIPENVLAKAGPLTTEERLMVERHPVLSATMVSLLTGAQGVMEAVLYHHERWDGTGYPYGLRGEAIPLAARILCLADSYDAMVCDRPYRLPLTCEEARAELAYGAGAQFDPDLVPLFLAISRR